jgi:UDP-2,3-diacylglucosamine pyrophosphatase LpxH
MERVRAIFLSDIHLGTRACQAGRLLAFLRDHEAEQIYLVGDIVDFWSMKRGVAWSAEQNTFVQKMLKRARHGVDVVLVPGNHDEFARKYLDHSFGGVEVIGECTHVTADGRRLWVTHGDMFDGVIQCAKWLAYAGDIAYEVTLKVNSWYNRARSRLGLGYWSLSRYLKLKVKRAVSYVSEFENAVAREARRRGAHGVVCGHIHHAEIREIDGVLYCNDGDWVESLTALVEHPDGRLEILDYGASVNPVKAATVLRPPLVAAEPRRDPVQA